MPPLPLLEEKDKNKSLPPLPLLPPEEEKLKYPKLIIGLTDLTGKKVPLPINQLIEEDLKVIR